MSQFTPAGGGGSELVTATERIVSYSAVNLSVPTAATEVALVVPSDVIWFRVKNRTDGTTQLGFGSGDSSSLYYTIWPGFDPVFTKKSGGTVTLYFQCPKAGQILELVYGHS